MLERPSDVVESGRLLTDPVYGSERHERYGAFVVRSPVFVALFRIIVTPGSDKYPWEHVSVSLVHEQRCPSWNEMCWVRDQFWGPEETVVQFHPPRSKHVNYHPYTLHLWRPWDDHIRVPPEELVGPKG